MKKISFNAVIFIISTTWMACNQTPVEAPNVVAEKALKHLLNLEFDKVEALATEESKFSLSLIKTGVVLASHTTNSFDSLRSDLLKSTMESRVTRENADTAWVELKFTHSQKVDANNTFNFTLLKRGPRWLMSFNSNFLFDK